MLIIPLFSAACTAVNLNPDIKKGFPSGHDRIITFRMALFPGVLNLPPHRAIFALDRC